MAVSTAKVFLFEFSTLFGAFGFLVVVIAIVGGICLGKSKTNESGKAVVKPKVKPKVEPRVDRHYDVRK